MQDKPEDKINNNDWYAKALGDMHTYDAAIKLLHLALENWQSMAEALGFTKFTDPSVMIARAPKL